MFVDRFKDAAWYGYPTDIVLGGAGGIGSWVALLLSRLTYRVIVYDMDVIESQNIGTQFYKKSQHDKNLKKASSVVYNSVEFGGVNCFARDEMFTQESMCTHLMISAFDNMAARKLFYNKWKSFVLENRNKEKVTLYVDGRMTAETGQVFFLKSKSEMELYEKTLFDDSEVEDLACSYKATPHTGPLIASLITSGVVNKVYNTALKVNVREIPFYVEFDIASYTIKSFTYDEYIANRL